MRQCPEKNPTTTKPPRDARRKGPRATGSTPMEGPKSNNALPTATSIRPSSITSFSANTSVPAIDNKFNPRILAAQSHARGVSDNTALVLSIVVSLLLALLAALTVYYWPPKRRCARRRRRGPGPTMEAGPPESAELVGVAPTVEVGGGQGEQQEGWPTQDTNEPGRSLPDSKFGERVFKTP